MKKILLASATGVALLCANFAFSHQEQSDSVSLTDGASVQTVENYRPEFILPDLSGMMRNVSEWQGKVLVVNFWATWCPPCVREMPMFIEAQKTFASQGVWFVGIAIDDPDKVREFAKELGGNYPLLVGGQEATIEVAYQFGNEVGILPYTVVVNPLGEMVYTHAGEMTREMVVKAISLALDSVDES